MAAACGESAVRPRSKQHKLRLRQLPTCFTELGIGVQDDAVLRELAERCTFYGKRTIGTFRVLGVEDIYAVYKMANC